MNLLKLYENYLQLIKEAGIVGHVDLIKKIFITYFANGHMLIEGPPGTGKTLIASTFAKYLNKQFKRIQFTSDMIPSDIIGGNIYNPKDQSFTFFEGPLFSDVILADEINRTPPRTQSALLEAMEERQVSIEGKTHKLDPHFMVLATQNPLEFEGVFSLPEAQVDRFLMKVDIDHLNEEDEVHLLDQKLKSIDLTPKISEFKFDKTLISEEIVKVQFSKEILSYIVRIISKTRQSSDFEYGSSFRGTLGLANCSRIAAILSGREFVTPDDVKFVAYDCLNHRVRFTSEIDFNNKSDVRSYFDNFLNSISISSL